MESPTPGGGASAAQTFTIGNPVPALTAISPASVPEGSTATTITLTGTSFLTSSVAEWNGSALTTTYNSATSLTAVIPASDLAATGTGKVTVVNPAPDGGASNAETLTITAVTAQQMVSITGNEVAYNPADGMLYVSTPSTAPANGNSIVPVNPLSGGIGTAVYAGSEPDLLSVSATGQYLYVSLDGSNAVERLSLPTLDLVSAISLGAANFTGPYYAIDLQASPVDDQTFATVRGNPGYSPEEGGGLIVYDGTTARPNPLCGWIDFSTGCVSGPSNGFPLLFGTIAWDTTGSEMFLANNEDTGFDFYTAQIGSNGFSDVVDYNGDFPGFNNSQIHYDATTGYVYGDDGTVVNPANGAVVGTFQASGSMVPDGQNGLAYFIGQSNSSVVIESFDINHFTPVNIYSLSNVVGTPVRLIRWGAHGVAFLTESSVYGQTQQGANELYIINDPSFVGNTQTDPTAQDVHVHRMVQRCGPSTVRRGSR